MLSDGDAEFFGGKDLEVLRTLERKISSNSFRSLLGQAIKGPVRSEQPIADDGMKMGVAPGAISEGMDDHDPPEDAVIEAQQGPKEHLQALLGAVA